MRSLVKDRPWAKLKREVGALSNVSAFRAPMYIFSDSMSMNPSSQQKITANHCKNNDVQHY